MLGSRKRWHTEARPEQRLGRPGRGALQRRLLVVGVLITAFGTPLVAGIATAAPASADTVVNGCTIVANPTATNFTNCPGADLSGANLSAFDLSYADFAGANLSGATLDNADLSNANLSLADLTATDLSNANLSSANLSDLSSTVGCVEVEGHVACFNAEFDDANLTDANLTKASLASCETLTYPFQLTGCAGSEFSGADLSGANFTGATLGTPCTGGACGQADFSGTLLAPSNQTVTATNKAGAVVTWPAPHSLPGATPGPCTVNGNYNPRTVTPGTMWVLGSHFVSCEVVDDHGNAGTGGFSITVNPSATSCTTLVSCNMSGLNLSGVDLFSEDLQGANLHGANLSNAELYFADLTGANLQGTNLSGADLNQTYLPGDNLSGANLSGADVKATMTNTNLHGANFTGAFVSAYLTGANLTGSNFTNASLESLFTGTLLVPSNQTVTATSAAGAVVTWPTPRSLPGATPGSCSTPSGSTFPIGTTTVTCGVVDDTGNAYSDGTFTVTVNPLPTTIST